MELFDIVDEGAGRSDEVAGEWQERKGCGAV